MATLIKNTEALKTYVSTAFNFTFTNIEPYIKRAEREFIKAHIGDTLYDAWATTAPSSGNAQKAYQLFCEASANIALFLYVPVGAVSIADNGILTVTSQATKTAEWWQVRDLQRTLVNLGFSAIDEALKLMEANEGDFSDWVDTEGYTIFKELLTPKTQDFQRYYNITNSRRTFVALRPYILESQNQIFNWLDEETFAQIKTGTEAEEKQARDYAQAAQVNFTVAKAIETGVFEFTPTGIFVRSLELPGEKTKEIDVNLMDRFVKARINTAEEYLKKLKAYILANADVFTDFEESDTPTQVFVYNTQSIVAF